MAQLHDGELDIHELTVRQDEFDQFYYYNHPLRICLGNYHIYIVIGDHGKNI